MTEVAEGPRDHPGLSTEVDDWRDDMAEGEGKDEQMDGGMNGQMSDKKEGQWGKESHVSIDLPLTSSIKHFVLSCSFPISTWCFTAVYCHILIGIL